ADFLLRRGDLLVGHRQAELEVGDDAVLRAAATGDRGTRLGLGELALQTIELTAQRLLAGLRLAHLLLGRLPAQSVVLLTLLVFLADLLRRVEARGVDQGL